MSEPTKAELQERLAESKAKVKSLAEKINDLDPEARVYHLCYKALSKLTKKGRSGGSYALASESPDVEAIRRVLAAISERFDLERNENAVTSLDTYFEPHLESQEDPRDQIIAQLIEGLRKA